MFLCGRGGVVQRGEDTADDLPGSFLYWCINLSTTLYSKGCSDLLRSNLRCNQLIRLHAATSVLHAKRCGVSKMMPWWGSSECLPWALQS
jgi:hypothetical protein